MAASPRKKSNSRRRGSAYPLQWDVSLESLVKKRVKNIEESDEHHDGFLHFMLFTRKLHRSIHLSRLDKNRHLKPTNLRLVDGNSGIRFVINAKRSCDISFNAMRGVHELTRPEGDVRWKEGRLIHRDLLQACPELTRDMAKRSFMITVCYSAVNGGDSTERRGASHGAPREDQIRMMKQRLGSGGGSGTGSKWSKLRDEGQKQAAAAGAGAQGGSLLAKQPSQSFSNMVLRSNAGDQARRLLVNVALDEARLGRASFAGACPTFGIGGYGSLVNVATAASKGPVEHAATAAAAAAASSPTGAGNGGCACFVFVCGSVEEMKLVVQGLRVGIDHCHHHSTTNSDLHMPNHHFGALCLWERQRWWRRCFGGGGGSGSGSGGGSGGGDEEGSENSEWFSDGLRERHALAGSGDLFLKLYRPHYVHRLVPPPGRIHHGVVAEVPYADNSYELVLSHGPVLLPKGQSKNAEEELVLPLPCPIFKKGKA